MHASHLQFALQAVNLGRAHPDWRFVCAPAVVYSQHGTSGEFSFFGRKNGKKYINLYLIGWLPMKLGLTPPEATHQIFFSWDQTEWSLLVTAKDILPQGLARAQGVGGFIESLSLSEP